MRSIGGDTRRGFVVSWQSSSLSTWQHLLSMLQATQTGLGQVGCLVSKNSSAKAPAPMARCLQLCSICLARSQQHMPERSPCHMVKRASQQQLRRGSALPVFPMTATHLEARSSHIGVCDS
jgi:hypothetical protein